MPDSDLTPHHVTARDAAAIVGVNTSPYEINRLCQMGAIESVVRDGRRFVVLASVRKYAESLREMNVGVSA